LDILLKYLSLSKKEMMVSNNLRLALNDYKWVVKILKSSETKEHLECTEKCFNLWDNKYLLSGTNSIEKKFLRRLRNNFWSNFHQKRISVTLKKKFVYNIEN
jgi:hypothetical protein